MDAGLYSVLLKWGLDSLSGVVRDKDPQHLQILLEAVKTRNALVLKRFDFAWTAAQEIIELNETVETALAEFLAKFPSSKKSKQERLDGFIHQACADFHPPFHRKLRKIRNSFEATNDLFSAYSIEFLEMLRADNLKVLLRSPTHESVSDAARTFRQLWSSYGAVMLSLIRVSSYDLRFWLTDISYFRLAEERAKIDRKILEDHFRSGSHDSWILSIEDHKMVKDFWEMVERSARDT